MACVQLDCSWRAMDRPLLTLCSLGFAVCELRKALIYKGMVRVSKTPKAGVAGSIPAGRAKPSKGFRDFLTSLFFPSTVKLQLAGCSRQCSR